MELSKEEALKLTNRVKTILKFIVNKIYPIIMKDIDNYQHFNWRVNLIEEFSTGVMSESLATNWARDFINAVDEVQKEDGHPHTRSDTFDLVIVYLRALTKEEVIIKIKAINGEKTDDL